MILVDKSYFDYDHEKTERPAPVVDWESTIKTDEEVHNILSMFGLGGAMKAPETLDEIQEHIIKQESYGS
jgi:hypothetical protein